MNDNAFFGGNGMRRFFCISVCLALVAAWTAAAAEERELTVNWLYPDQPPIFINEGLAEGMGIGSRTMKWFVRELKNYKHTYLAANYQRIVRTIKETDNSCCVSLYRTSEREKFIEYTIPVRTAPSNALIILQDQKGRFEPYLDAQRHVSLEALIKNNFRIGVAKGRVYRGVIDEILNKYRAKNYPGIVEHTSHKEMVNKLLEMLMMGRIDACIGYPAEVMYAARSMPKMGKIISLHVAGMAEFGLSYAGCSKSEKGKAIVKELNAILLKYRKTPEFLDIMEHWMDPEAIQRFRSYTEREFKE